MLTLEQLKGLGAISIKNNLANEKLGTQFVNASQLNALAIDNYTTVVCDNYRWIACDGDIRDSIEIWSCDQNDHVWNWNKNTLTLTEFALNANKLVTISRKKYEREVESMSSTMDFQSMMGNAQMPNVPGAGVPNVNAMTGFDGFQVPNAQAQAVTGVTKAEDSAAVASYAQRHGRIKFYITQTDACLKYKKSKQPVEPRELIAPYKDDNEEVKKLKETPNKVAKSHLKCLTKLSIVEAAPSTIKGIYLTMPVQLTNEKVIENVITNPENSDLNLSNSETIGRMFNKDDALNIILNVFHGMIKEDEQIIPNATTIRVTPKAKDDGTWVPKIGLISQTSGRKTVLTYDNYVPLNVLETVEAGKAKGDKREQAAFALQSAVGKEKKDYDNLTPDTKEWITFDEKAPNDKPKVSSKIFDSSLASAGFKHIPAFVNKDSEAHSKGLPLKTYAKGKTSEKWSYKQLKKSYTDPDGPLKAGSKYNDLLKKAGVSTTEFETLAKTVLKKKGKGGSGAKDSFRDAFDAYTAYLTSGGQSTAVANVLDALKRTAAAGI